ncbi:LLM class flavin-dependent oxidoreductase [Neomicrococcus aestuarii]|uniref:5,10-methylene tetrahydromethanopterin reductase n=1 Tax=Neomicrococcus aestuarii TaxID=556325 RepID=A0A1L2ZN43_9MICC|nr:LLM class flavin-dependent oxidoreductase [Neomicrococcus aestuarii]APF40559.1 5,10-methylene tetrahydromethanopterin reductase [Neomicrococcus aestuarii]
MSKRISLNAFDMTCVSHQSPGLWRHPDNRADEYNTIEYWTDLAKILERGKFDALFLADVLGIYDVYKNSSAPALIDADQVPLNDPFMQVSAMASVTKNLAFAVTSALTYEQPYALARKFSTLDHLTRGRIGWNVVTSYLESAARNLGYKKQLDHDARYDLADEFMEVVYKLWEGSWEDGAVVRDRERGVFTDPSKVHPINHAGEHFNVPGIHLSEPSVQRTPAIFQAGASSRGRRFGAQHGEGVFLNSINTDVTRKQTDAFRDELELVGRPRDAAKMFALVTTVVADSDAAAEKLFKEYQSYSSQEGAMTFYGGWSGLDLSQYATDQELAYIDTNAARSALSIFTVANPNKRWTPGDIAEYLGVGGIGPVFVGSPETVADEVERWVDDSGLDGINLAYAITPGSFEQFTDLVVPELQKRGRVWDEYEGTTLREYVAGEGNKRVADSHPAAQYRNAYVGLPSAADSAATDSPENVLSR